MKWGRSQDHQKCDPWASRLAAVLMVDITLLHYITCYLLDTFNQSDLHTQYCGQSPQEQFGMKCLAQGHNDMLTALGFEPVTPLIRTPPHNQLRHTPPHLQDLGNMDQIKYHNIFHPIPL